MNAVISKENQLDKLDFIEKDPYSFYWSVNGTKFKFYIGVNNQIYIQEYLSGMIVHTSFEQMLSKLDPKIQRKFLFHLDLFR